MRDKLCKLDYLNEDIDFDKKSVIQSREKIKLLYDDMKNGIQTHSTITNEECIINVKKGIIRKADNILTAKYSRGDEVESLWYEFNTMCEVLFDIGAEDILLYKVREIFSLAILLEAPKEVLQKIVDCIDEAKSNDVLFDLLILCCGLNRKIKSDSYGYRNLYKPLCDIATLFLEDSEKATSEFCEYMNKKWYKNEYGTGYKTSHKEPGYTGLWAFDWAAMAKILKLDDSLLKENNHYPYELRYFKNGMKFTPNRMLNNKQEPMIYKQGIPKFPKLEKVVPLPFHEKMNQFIVDYKELSEKNFWEKYELNQIWFDLNDYIVAIKKLGTLGKVIINVLVDFGFILQLDYKEDIADYDVENFWGDEPVKLVQFDIEDDQEYYAYIPQSTQLESIFDVKIYDVEVAELEQGGLEMDE